MSCFLEAARFGLRRHPRQGHPYGSLFLRHTFCFRKLLPLPETCLVEGLQEGFQQVTAVVNPAKHPSHLRSKNETASYPLIIRLFLVFCFLLEMCWAFYAPQIHNRLLILTQPHYPKMGLLRDASTRLLDPFYCMPSWKSCTPPSPHVRSLSSWHTPQQSKSWPPWHQAHPGYPGSHTSQRR